VGVIIALSFIVILGIHLLLSFSIQAIYDFPSLVLEISLEEDGSLRVMPFRGPSRTYPPGTPVIEVLEDISDPLWLRLYWYSVYRNRYRCRLRIGEDDWFVNKSSLDAQRTLQELRQSWS